MPLSIAYTSFAALRDRCQTAAVRTVRGEPEYEDGAVVPSGLWQPLTPDAAQQLQPGPGVQDSVLVEIVAPPLPAGPLEDYASETGGRSAVYLGQAHSEPNALTTTVIHENGRRLGLHLDNWDRLRYAAKDTGRRRLCLNLGPGTRHLLLCPVGAQALCRAVHPGDYTNRYPHTDDLRAYVAAGKPLWCLRIRLDPGDGYLVPTEYLPHDGSTEDEPTPSSAAFWLGRWARGTLPSLI
ncbi:hypothetical protein AB0H73_23365 [Streptomyces olivoreticuli]